MATITIDDVKDITVDDYAGIQIDFVDHRGSKTSLELSRYDAEYLMEQLEQYFHGQTFVDIKSEHEDKLQEMRETIDALREENANLRLG